MGLYSHFLPIIYRQQWWIEEAILGGGAIPNSYDFDSFHSLSSIEYLADS